MTNFNKDTLVEEFIDTTKILDNREYKDLFLYKVEQERLKGLVKPFVDDCIRYFIKTYLYDCNYTWEFNYTSLEDLINDIEEFELHEIADSKVDMHYYDLMNSYITFDNWLDINERNDLSITETIQFAQYEAYNDLYETIRSDFVEFLKRK